MSCRPFPASTRMAAVISPSWAKHAAPAMTSPRYRLVARRRCSITRISPPSFAGRDTSSRPTSRTNGYHSSSWRYAKHSCVASPIAFAAHESVVVHHFAQELLMAMAESPASNPPIEIAFPDLTPHAEGSIGIPYVWTFASDEPGAHVVLQALTHGNEVCGAIALDWLLREHVRPVRGTLSVVFANVAAYERFDPANPFASRCIDEAFNRLWTSEVLDAPRHSAELRRARELRPLYDRV